MSRGFVKEGDQEEAPIIPPRAALPVGAINYVTPTGMDMLKKEREQLEKERANLNTTHEQQRRVELAVIQGKMELLNERIASARVLDPAEQPQDEVRFGATVSYKILPAPTLHKFQIVGVDEANVNKGKIAFVAPLAKAITGQKEGDRVPFKLGGKEKELLLISVEYHS